MRKSGNYFEQSQTVDTSFIKKIQTLEDYQRQFPEKISFILGEVQLKDQEHFDNWVKEKIKY